jgi:predicted Rossmann fold flavoprotein
MPVAPGDLPIVVVGAGAAGLMAAIFAARGGRRVIVLERTPDGGRKILISGGGRCNVLPSEVEEHRFVSASSPNTLRKMLRSWRLTEQRRFFEETLGIPLAVERETGKLFPVSNRARDVRDGLIAAARGAGAEFRFGSVLQELRPGPSGSWQLGLRDDGLLLAGAVVLATGGLSVAATGSDGIGLRLARELGHTIHDTYPALTPLTADPAVHAHLAGISLEVRIVGSFAGQRSESTGGFLFTHRGYSGPAVLDLSHLAVRSRLAGGEPARLLVCWTGRETPDWERLLTRRLATSVAGVVGDHLPARLAATLIQEGSIDGAKPLSRLTREERVKLVSLLTRYPLPWSGDEGYKKAEVTGGGVALDQIDPVTLESRVHPGLFLCGEILDAFGPIGGYNFLWAWATGRAAGLAAAGAHQSRPRPDPTRGRG